MSQAEDTMAAYNEHSKQDRLKAAAEHIAELETKRIASEAVYNNAVKSNWERLLSKRSTQQVLRRLTLPRLQ